MPAARPVFFGLKRLLCGDELVPSDLSHSFISPLGDGHIGSQVMAPQLSAALENLLASRDECDDFFKDLLTRSDADSHLLDERDTVNEPQFRQIAYFLLPFRLMRALSYGTGLTHNIGEPVGPENHTTFAWCVPKTLALKPGSRVYPRSMFDWPKVLRTTLDSLLESRNGDLQSAHPGGKDLASRLTFLSDLDVSSQMVTVIHNVQTACVHLEFLLRGSNAGAAPGSGVRIPGLPSTTEAFVVETERITTSTLDEISRAKIDRYLKGSIYKLHLPLLVAALISPVFLFQTRNITGNSWTKKSLVQTSLRLGNQKPDILVETEAAIWRLLFNICTSSTPTPLLPLIIAALEDLPWHNLEGDAISSGDREWFKCGLPPAEAPPVRSGIFVYASPPVQPATITDQAPVASTQPEEGPVRSSKRRANYSDTHPGRHKRHRKGATNYVNTTASPRAPRASQCDTPARPSAPTTLQTSSTPPFSPHDARHLLTEGSFSTTTSDFHFDFPDFNALTNNIGIDSGAMQGGQPDGDTPTERDVFNAGGDAFGAISSSTIHGSFDADWAWLSGSMESSMAGPTALPTENSAAHGISTTENPVSIDLDAKFLFTKQCSAPEHNGKKIEDSSIEIYAYTMEGHAKMIYPISHHKGILDMLISIHEVVKRDWYNQQDPLYVPELQAVPSLTPRPKESIFLHWVRRFSEDAGYSGGDQSLQRWRVLYFSRPPQREGYHISGDFKLAIEGKILEGYQNCILLDDQSVSMDPTDPGRVRAIEDPAMLFPDYPLKWGEQRKIFAAHNIACSQGERFDLLFCSETVAFKATHPDNMQFRTWTSPSQALSFYSILKKGAVDYWQMGPSGLGVALTVDVGGVYVVVCDPGDGVFFRTSLSKLLPFTKPGQLPLRCRMESIYLQTGNRIVIPPCALYFLYAEENTVLHKRYFYSTVHMPLTHLALSHSLVLGARVNREPAMNVVALPILCRIAVFWYDALVRDPPIKDFSPFVRNSPDGDLSVSEKSIAYHVPNFRLIQSLGDFYALINTIIFMGAYDLRMYPASPLRPDISKLSADDEALLQLARSRAMRLRQWLPTKYEIINSKTHEYVSIEDLAVLSLLHHGNTLYRYKHDAELRYPAETHLFSAEETRQQILACLAPFDHEVQSFVNRVEAQEGRPFPAQDRAVYLTDDVQRALVAEINPAYPLPLFIIPTSRDIPHSDLEIQLRG